MSIALLLILQRKFAKWKLHNVQTQSAVSQYFFGFLNMHKCRFAKHRKVNMMTTLSDEYMYKK